MGSFKYDREVAEMIANPYPHLLRECIEKVKGAEASTEEKKGALDDIEHLMARGIVSDRGTLDLFGELISLLDVSEVSREVCVMLGHVVQNVPVAIDELVKCGVIRHLQKVFERDRETGDKVVFLLAVVANGTDEERVAKVLGEEGQSLLSSIEACGVDERARKKIEMVRERMRK
jgi:hypothetical protein